MNYAFIFSLLCLLGLTAGHDIRRLNHPRQRPTDQAPQATVTTTESGAGNPTLASSSSNTPGASSQPSSDCRAELEKVEDSMPTPPPGLTSFSSSYYETHTRTASEPEGDCAWVTDIPETFHGEIYDYWAEVEDWRLHDFDPVQEADKRKDGDAFVTCVRENPDSFPCAAAFWDHVLDVVLRYEPSESGGSDGNRDGNGDGNEQSNGRLAVPEGLGVAMTVAGTLFLGAIAEL